METSDVTATREMVPTQDSPVPSRIEESTSGAPPTATGATAPAAGAPAPASAAATPAQPAAAQNSQQPQGKALPAAPNHNFGGRVLDAVLGALGGTDETAYRRATADDVTQGLAKQEGQMIATHVKSGPGQQWKRIIAGALQGGAAAAATKPGPNFTARATAAGVGSGIEMAQQHDTTERQHANEDYDAEQKALTTKANRAYLAQQTAALAMQTKRMGLEINEKSLEGFKAIQEQLASNPANHELGQFSSIDEFMKFSPQLQDRIANELPHGKVIPIILADGSVRAYGIDEQWEKQRLDKDMPFRRVVGFDKQGKPQYVTETIKAGSRTNGQYMDATMASWGQEHGDAVKAYEEGQQNTRAAESQAGETNRTKITQQGENYRANLHEAGENRRAEVKGDAATKALQKEASSAADKIRPMSNLLESAEKYYGKGKFDSAGDLGLIIEAVRSMNPGTVRLPNTELEMEVRRGTYGERAQRWIQQNLQTGTLPTQFRDELMGVIRNETTTAATSAAKDWIHAYGGADKMPQHLRRFAQGVDLTPSGNGDAAGNDPFAKFGGKRLQKGAQ